MRRLDGITDSTDRSLSTDQESEGQGSLACWSVHGLAKSWTRLSDGTSTSSGLSVGGGRLLPAAPPAAQEVLKGCLPPSYWQGPRGVTESQAGATLWGAATWSPRQVREGGADGNRDPQSAGLARLDL